MFLTPVNHSLLLCRCLVASSGQAMETLICLESHRCVVTASCYCYLIGAEVSSAGPQRNNTIQIGAAWRSASHAEHSDLIVRQGVSGRRSKSPGTGPGYNWLDFSDNKNMPDLCRTAVLPSWRRTHTARVPGSCRTRSRGRSRTGHTAGPSSRSDTWGGKRVISLAACGNIYASCVCSFQHLSNKS